MTIRRCKRTLLFIPFGLTAQRQRAAAAKSKSAAFSSESHFSLRSFFTTWHDHDVSLTPWSASQTYSSRMADVEMKPKTADSGDAGVEAAHTTTDGQAATGVAQTNDSSFTTSSSSSTTRDQGSRERKGSGSILRPNRTRARSTSSSMLVRLTTRSSSIMDPSGGTGTSSNGGDDDDASSKKSKQKYKSGVNWNALSPQNEPFMGEDISQERSDEDVADPELEEMRAVGGTAAAKKWARQSSIGDPIFASYLRASSEAAAAQAAAQAKAQSQAHAQALAFSQGHGPFAAGSPSQFHSRRNSTLVTPMRSRGELTSTSDESQSPVSDDVLTQAAQQVLGQAREAAVADGGVQEPVAEANGAADGTTQEEAAATDADKESKEAEEAAANAKPVKRKTILGFPTKSKEAKEKKSKDKKKDKESKSKASSRNASTTDLNAMTTTAEATTSAGDGQPEKRQSTTNASETGTVGRRRRYADTRQLDLLASELAAEALLGPPYADGTAHLGGHMTPEPRRASMMSVMAMSGATGMSTPSNASHADLSSTSPHLNGGLTPLTTLPPPQPAFYAESHRNSGSSASSPYSASPRSGNGELPRFEPVSTTSRLEPETGLTILIAPIGVCKVSAITFDAQLTLCHTASQAQWPAFRHARRPWRWSVPYAGPPLLRDRRRGSFWHSHCQRWSL